MAEPQFEQFQKIFDDLPQHIKASTQCYSSENKVPNDSIDSFNSTMCKKKSSFESSDEEDDRSKSSDLSQLIHSNLPPPDLLPIRPRRRLPEIPKHKKPLDPSLLILRSIPSLAQELYAAEERKRKNQVADDFSPEDVKQRGIDVDSGTSTTHSPINPASLASSPTSGISTLELLEKTCRQLEPTHHVLHKFIPRHADELELDIGDPIYRAETKAYNQQIEEKTIREGKGYEAAKERLATEYLFIDLRINCHCMCHICLIIYSMLSVGGDRATAAGSVVQSKHISGIGTKIDPCGVPSLVSLEWDKMRNKKDFKERRIQRKLEQALIGEAKARVAEAKEVNLFILLFFLKEKETRNLRD
ncbi:JNK-interacting protein 1 [Nymphon striatum]|nr:JNK-interacting protein 1 [Nymphon striatum]